jgi:hypothetical protein
MSTKKYELNSINYLAFDATFSVFKLPANLIEKVGGLQRSIENFQTTYARSRHWHRSGLQIESVLFRNFFKTMHSQDPQVTKLLC